MRIRLVSIKVKKYKINANYGIVCTTTEIKDGSKRYAVEVISLKDNSVVERKIGLLKSIDANKEFAKFKIKYGCME